VNKAMEKGAGRAELDSAAAAFRTVGDILGLFQIPVLATDRFEGVMDLVVRLREDARQRKDFATADRIRDGLAAFGIVLEDTRDGVRWKQK
jgi:cysteinyl-tRNA synthetase